jgi:hypothetical protein
MRNVDSDLYTTEYFLNEPGESRKNAQFIQLDSKTVSFPAETFDCIFILDFAEYFYPEEFDFVLSNAFFI